MTVGQVIEELQKINPNLYITSLTIVRDELGEHVCLALDTKAETSQPS